MLRCNDNYKLTGKVSTQSMLDKLKMLSVDQMNAQIKLTEMWKAEKVSNCPLNL